MAAKHPLVGTWQVTAVGMVIGGQFRWGDAPRGSVVIGDDGRIDEQIAAEFGSVPVRWTAAGTFRIDGDTLISRASTHSLGDYAGKDIRRHFEFQPGSHVSRMLLHFKSGNVSMGFGLRRV